jgi:hypothetical protein
MQTYQNDYFGLQIDFPDHWKLVSWRHAKINRSHRSMYQTSDDDLPTTGPRNSKFLFTAALYAPESSALVDADIEMSIFRVKPSEDMRQSLIENFERQREFYKSNGVTTSITNDGNVAINGVEFGIVDQESKSSARRNWYRFLYRRVDKTLWLYVKIAGHKKPAFAEAIGIVSAMQHVTRKRK